MRLLPRGGLSAMFPLTVMLLLAMLTLWLARTIGLYTWTEPPEPSRDPDYIVEGFTLTRLSESGQPRYVLTSDRMVHLPVEDTSHLTRPVLRQAQPGKPEMRVRADRGVLTSGGDVAHLHDNVEVLQAGAANGPQGKPGAPIRINTSYLRVLPDEDRADTTAAVRIEQDGTILTGSGMEFDNRYRRFRLLSSVRATYVSGRAAKAGP